MPISSPSVAGAKGWRGERLDCFRGERGGGFGVRGGAISGSKGGGEARGIPASKLRRCGSLIPTRVITIAIAIEMPPKPVDPESIEDGALYRSRNGTVELHDWQAPC